MRMQDSIVITLPPLAEIILSLENKDTIAIFTHK